MKLGRKQVFNSGSPAKNKMGENLKIVAILLVVGLLIGWIQYVGRKAEETIQVVMLGQDVFKNQAIVEDMLVPHDMLIMEFERYGLDKRPGGVELRSVVLWEDRGDILNNFAAFHMPEQTLLRYRNLIATRVENQDRVLYSFPGKDIVPLDVGGEEIGAFKTFLRPGDRLNIEAIFSQTEVVVPAGNGEDRAFDGGGGGGQGEVDEIEVFRTVSLFTDIMVADLLNTMGESILDIYEQTQLLPAHRQAQLERSQEFKDRVEPSTLLVALTPEELERYYYFLSKQDIEFRVSMPQRVE